MLFADTRKTCYAVYQQNGVIRLWDSPSGMWLRDIADPQLVTAKVTALHFDSSITIYGKTRTEVSGEQRSEVQGAFVGTSSGAMYSWTSEGTAFVPANYAHGSSIAAIAAPRGTAYILSIGIDGLLIKGVWGPNGSLIKQSEVNILSLKYRQFHPVHKDQTSVALPATTPAISEVHMGMLEQFCVIAYGPGIYIVDSHNTGITFCGLQSSILAMACEHNLVAVTLQNSSIVSVFGFYRHEHLLRVARLVSPEVMTSLEISVNHGTGPNKGVSYAVTACSAHSVSLFTILFPAIDAITMKGSRIPSIPPLLELRGKSAPGDNVLAAIPQYIKTRAFLHIVRGTYTLPTLVTEEIPLDLLKGYFLVQSDAAQDDAPNTAKIVTTRRTISSGSAALLNTTLQSIHGATKSTAAFDKFTRFNEADPSIQSAVLPKATMLQPQTNVATEGFTEVVQDDSILPIEQVIAQGNKHRLHILLTTTTKQARINTAKMLSDEGVHTVFASLLRYANNTENAAYISEILEWVQTLIEERPALLKSERSLPALSGFKSLFHSRMSYRRSFESLASSLQPLRFSNEVLTDLRRQVEEEAQAQNPDDDQSKQSSGDEEEEEEEDD